MDRARKSSLIFGNQVRFVSTLLRVADDDGFAVSELCNVGAAGRARPLRASLLPPHQVRARRLGRSHGGQLGHPLQIRRRPLPSLLPFRETGRRGEEGDVQEPRRIPVYVKTYLFESDMSGYFAERNRRVDACLDANDAGARRQCEADAEEVPSLPSFLGTTGSEGASVGSGHADADDDRLPRHSGRHLCQAAPPPRPGQAQAGPPARLQHQDHPPPLPVPLLHPTRLARAWCWQAGGAASERPAIFARGFPKIWARPPAPGKA